MPGKTIRSAFSIGVALLTLSASFALGQNADKNSAGPTKNDLQLRVVEPLPGATVVGSSVRVTVATSLPRTTQESSGTSNMPNPSFRVYLGNTLKGEIKRDDNVLTIEDVPVGSQRLIVEAMNSSGEVIDRKEIKFQTVAAVAATAPLGQIPEPATASAPPPVAPATAMAPATASSLSTSKDLPHTASAAPRAALAGLALITVGLLVSRNPGA
jgi:hypothetical protein